MNFSITRAKLFVVGMALGLVLVVVTTTQNSHSSENGRILSETEAITSVTPFPVDSFEKVFNLLQTDVGRRWYLLGNTTSTQDQQIQYTITLTDIQAAFIASNPQTTFSYHVKENGQSGMLVRNTGENTLSARINVSDWEPGTYTLHTLVVLQDYQFTSEPHVVYVTYPLYVTWTIDWEGYDVKEDYLNAMDTISVNHGIPLTHFFNPRLYTNEKIAKERQDYLTQWVITRRNDRGHAIGLHLHMFPDMVSAAGVDPHEHAQQWGSTLTDGYDVLTSEYSYEETVEMLAWSKSIFKEKGLGDPIMFRAGGWFADEDTLRAVQDTGFVLDSSGRTAYEFGKNNVKGHWDLSPTAQPYKPNRTDQNNAGTPTLTIWEFPNNGADSWAYSAGQMIERFNQNYPTKTLSEKRVVTFLSHPEWFHVDQPKVEAVFNHTDRYLFEQDNGPVVYVTLEDAYNIWK